jgi:hypothetical protein
MKISLSKDKAKSVFVLEDSQMRIDWFKKVFSFTEKLFITDDPRVALEELRKTKFDIIFLDHDLEEVSIEQESRPDFDWNEVRNGLVVAKHLRETKNRETECIIHSMNPEGAANMVHAHPFNTMHVPFWMLHDNLEIM